MSDRPLDPGEIRSMSPEERRKLLATLRLELARLREQARVGTLANTARIRIVRKNIARILTIMREEELGIKRRPGEQRQ
ncbi:MAG: 50S ribosomal protein L29 [Thermoprotei archaeon]|nr:MAG: 50S ribosomal protein L29 [Thermoprotei archaeon]